MSHSASSHVLLLQGRAAVLENAALLEQLAARCRQPGAMHWLQYFLSSPDFRRKEPYLVLLTHSKETPRALRVENVRAAVLLFEYCVFGRGTKVFSTDDSSGFRTVISRVEDRQAAAIGAIHALLGQGAQVILTSRDDGGRPTALPRLNEHLRVLWTRRYRPVAKTLLLEPTYTDTLKKLGKSTRFNLGYYRRRLLAKMPCEFVADARGLLSERDLRVVNAASLNPVPWELMKLQYASACHLPGGFLIGLRGPLGEWLSLIGGWRQDTTTVLHWQTNTSGHERSSLGTVMRSYFLESEIARGTGALTFYGGTPHSMQHAFVAEQATDLAVRRRGWKAISLVILARSIGTVQRRLGRMNFIVELLCDRGLRWRTPQEAYRPVDTEASSLRLARTPIEPQQAEPATVALETSELGIE